MKQILFRKKILFISADFFGYHKEIIGKLEEFGASVTYFDERPSNDFFTKSVIRVFKTLMSLKLNNYYKDIIDKTKEENFDYIFIIKGEAITTQHLNELKKLHKNAKFILYLWDSISYNPNAEKIKSKFDKVLTFDPTDAEKSNMEFRPLFYIDDYKNISVIRENHSIDLLFIGTVHTDRYFILKKIEAQLKEQGLNPYFYMYYPSKILFWFKKALDRSFRNAVYSDFKFKSLSKQDVIHLYKSSKAILDIERPKQNGLTIRTIEVLGSKRKLLTTNSSIEKYDFYDNLNQNIISRDDPKINLRFFKTEYKDIKEETYNYYSINYWIEQIFR